MKILKYTISLVALLMSISGLAQKQKNDFVPSEILLSTDVIGLGKTLFTDETKLEFHSKIDFHQYYLAGEFGIDKIGISGKGFDYSSEGTFFRVGPHVNLMPYNIHRSSIFFGVMYARSSFKDEMIYNQPDVGWGKEKVAFSNEDLSARWYELNMGINVKIAGPIYFGYTLRFKFAKKLYGNGELMPFEIPGFGEADKGSRFGFNYYLIYKLRFRDKPLPKRPVKKEENKEAKKAG